MLVITKENFEQEVLQSKVPVMVDFYADWCGPCKMMAPVFEEIEREMPDVKFCKLNIDEQMELARKYKVMTIPTFIAFQEGVELKRAVGAVGKSDIVGLLG
ncbi:MAG: thioredoxin [Lachnospiraceae bacterium]|nr:thioredoxin [Lachnospiraceae bacterium]